MNKNDIFLTFRLTVFYKNLKIFSNTKHSVDLHVGIIALFVRLCLQLMSDMLIIIYLELPRMKENDC